MLIGGFAVVVHGGTRFTRDIDLLIDDAPENIARVRDALSILSDNAAAEVTDDDVRQHVVVRVADEIVVDLMGQACGVSYADALADVEHVDLGGVAVPVASPAALIRMKNTYRPQDRIDREYLQSVIASRS